MSIPGNWVAAEHIKLVKPEVKKEKQELPMQGMTDREVAIKPDKKANIALTIEEVKHESHPLPIRRAHENCP